MDLFGNEIYSPTLFRKAKAVAKTLSNLFGNEIYSPTLFWDDLLDISTSKNMALDVI